MPAGLAIGTAIAGAATATGAIVNGKMQANASHRASDAQSDYDNRALADAEAQRARDQQIQDAQLAKQKQQDADYSAWLNGGTISQLRAAAQGSPGASNQPPMPTGAPIMPAPAPAPMSAPSGGGAMALSPLTPQTATLAQLRSGQTPVGGVTPASGPLGTSTVTLQSPDGAEKQTFAANDPQVQTYLAKGAVRVG